MKTIYISFFITLLVYSLHAQEKQQFKKYQIGFEASPLTVDYIFNVEFDESVPDYKGKYSCSGGLFGFYNFSDHFTIQTGVKYVWATMKKESTARTPVTYMIIIF